MYVRPKLERFCTFRELTQVGRNTGWDAIGIWLDADIGCTRDPAKYGEYIGCTSRS